VAADENREKVNILLVDDRPDKLLALEAIVAELNENILKANSGAEALRLLLKHDVAVILLDVNMPIMDGFETASLIRQRKNLEHTPIIFITGINFNENHISHGYSIGAADYICTPVVPEILKTKIAVFIELYRSREQVRKQGQLLVEAAERRAADVELRLQDLLNRLDLGVFSCTPEGKLIEANPAFFRILGIARQDQTPDVIISKLSRTEPPAQQVHSGEEIEIESNGVRKWFSLSFTAARTPKGEAVVEGLLEDVTVRKEAEEALKESDRRKDHFLAVLSHELRNPLAALHSAIQLGERSSDSEKWTRDIFTRQVRHLGRLTDDLLDIARINQDKMELNFQDLNLSEIIHRAANVVRPTIEAQRHFFEEIVEPDLYISGDATRIEQVIVNLLQNAAKYTAPGGEICMSARRQGEEIVVAVTDTGVGISPDMLPKVFEPFMQSDSSLDRAQGGLGIGLTLVKRIVELHRGSVSAQSGGNGKGSEFSFRVPALQEKQSAASSAELDSSVHQGTGKILIVDDNRDSVVLMAELLRISGYEVIMAYDGETAIEMAIEQKPTVILLDIGLPGANGYQVATRLKSMSEFQDALLIAISGYGQESDIALSRQAGFDHHLVKPVDFAVLGEILEKSDTRLSLNAESGSSSASERPSAL